MTLSNNLAVQSYLLLEIGCGPSFGQKRIHFTQRCFMRSFVEIGQVVLEKIFNFVHGYFVFRYLPLYKGADPHLNKHECLKRNDTVCPVWLKLAQWFWRRRWKYKKVYRQTDGCLGFYSVSSIFQPFITEYRRTDRRAENQPKVIKKAQLSFHAK